MIYKNEKPEYEKSPQRSVIPAKAGIQANWAGKQTWIPACAGMTRRGANVRREALPFSSSVGERKLML